MKNIFLALFICLFFSACTKQADFTNTDTVLNGEPFEGTILTNQANSPTFKIRKWQGIPSISIADNGNIYAVWYTGANGEEAGNYITVAVSKDKGVTWKQNALIINPNIKGVRFFDPVFFKDKYGNVSLFIAKSRNNMLWDGKGGVWMVKLTYTNDMFTCSTPRRLADGVMMCSPTESSINDNVLYPIAVWQKNNPPNTGIHIYKSYNYNGLNGQLGFAKESTIPFPANLRMFDEHQIIQLRDSSYLVMIRGIDGIYYSKSRDLQNWDSAKRFTALGAAASSRFFLGRLKSGKIALVLNNNTIRSDLKIFLSSNETATWSSGMMIDNKSGVSYPDLAQAPDGKISVVYDYDRFNQMNINYATFTEEDIVNNRPNNIKRTVICKRN